MSAFLKHSFVSFIFLIFFGLITYLFNISVLLSTRLKALHLPSSLSIIQEKNLNHRIIITVIKLFFVILIIASRFI